MIRQGDSLKAVLDSVFAAPAYQWEEHRDPLAFLGHWLTVAREWIEGLRASHPLGFRMLVAGLALLALATLAHAAWVLAATLKASHREGSLPVASRERRDRAWHQREAERLAASGHYAEAVQQEFLALVLALDAREQLRFHPSKTPAEYGREVSLPPAARGEFLDLVRGVYGFAFARHPCGPAEWDRWRTLAAPERYAPAS